ncbi:helix-hairpin-helix domain-containing protein [Pseudomonas sp.]|uniref:ComEA family DNA-binding protein n=1 Tax=Pseudomonas sp. TaxID=306 RepID=UPI002584B213|nr:helix-hairpin-helix domain-containing protein [Pseudomonas sp.]
MRIPSLASLLFVILASVSIAANAAPPAAPQPSTSAMVVQGDKVSLNKADAETLQRELAGIGLAKAQAIVAHREANGPFSSVDELLEVKGIGKSLLDKNREKLALE